MFADFDAIKAPDKQLQFGAFEAWNTITRQAEFDSRYTFVKYHCSLAEWSPKIRTRLIRPVTTATVPSTLALTPSLSYRLNFTGTDFHIFKESALLSGAMPGTTMIMSSAQSASSAAVSDSK